MNMILPPGICAVDEILSNGADHGPPTINKGCTRNAKTPTQSTRSGVLPRREPHNGLPLDLKRGDSLRKATKESCKNRYQRLRQAHTTLESEIIR